MARKGFCVKIQLELHAVTCPGVWLCPNGKVALRITAFGSTLESDRVSPIFPLLFHNKFNFKKTFTRLAALTELQWSLEHEFLFAELIQWLSPCGQVILLATFEASLADVLYPVTNYKRLLTGIDVDLLMEPSKHFPGIIAPKIEISTKTVIEEVMTFCEGISDRAHVVNPKLIDSKRCSCAHRKRPTKGIIRQRKVCHSRHDKVHGRHGRPRYQCNPCSSDSTRIVQCDDPPKAQSKCPKNVEIPSWRNRRTSNVYGDTHMFENCPVCLKYKCYFSNEQDHLQLDTSYKGSANFHNQERCFCYSFGNSP